MLDILQYLLYLQQQVFTEFKNNNVMYLYDNWVNISKFPWELLKIRHGCYLAIKHLLILFLS